MVKFLSSLLLLVAASAGALPQDWQLGFQTPASPVMEKFEQLHDLLLIIITAIVFIVFALLAYVILRFNRKTNPVPSTFSHNTTIEIIWTVIPLLILVAISLPTFKMIYYVNETPEDVEFTLKVVGHQWYWHYEYPDHGGFQYDSYMIPDRDLQPGQPRLLTVDNHVVLPVQTNIRILITASDVIHNWAVPALGIKMDAVPGRINETWVHINEPGWYYGQCSQLCGANHGFMPIAIKAVSKEEFLAWTESAKAKFASAANYHIASINYSIK